MKKRYLTNLGIIVLLLLIFVMLLVLGFIGWLLIQNRSPVKQQEEQAPPVQIEEPLLKQQDEKQAMPTPADVPQTTPEILPPLLIPSDSTSVPRQDAPPASQAAPLHLPNMPRTPATMSDEEKQAAIEAVARDAAHTARTSGMSEAAALEAATQAKEQASRIFYRTK